jgi:hypothetical protein
MAARDEEFTLISLLIQLLNAQTVVTQEPKLHLLHVM